MGGRTADDNTLFKKWGYVKVSIKRIDKYCKQWSLTQ